MNRKRIKDRNDIIDFTQDLIANKHQYVILDTETTGLGENDVIVQIGMLDLDGNILLDTLVKPTKRKRISSEASAINGITMKMLQDAPTFKELYPKFCEIISNKKLLIYNARYDAKLLLQTALQDGFTLKECDALCIMLGYSAFKGEWSEKYGNYKYQKLPNGDHSAIGDCKAILALIKKMAAAAKTPLTKKKWWQIFE
jgi:DNA polymerase III subunit epsilon